MVASVVTRLVDMVMFIVSSADWRSMGCGLGDERVGG